MGEQTLRFYPPSIRATDRSDKIEISAALAAAGFGTTECGVIWKAIMAKLSAVCAAGCFAENPTQARFGQLKVLESRIDGETGHLTAELLPYRLHGYLAVALSNAIAAFHHQVAPLLAASVVIPTNWSSSHLPLLDRKALPFLIDDDRVRFASRMEIELEFDSPVVERVAAQAEEAFGAWFSCVNLSVFSDEPAISDGSYIHLDEDVALYGDTLIIRVGDYLFSEPLAIDGLLSVFCKIHSTLGGLRSVTISD